LLLKVSLMAQISYILDLQANRKVNSYQSCTVRSSINNDGWQLTGKKNLSLTVCHPSEEVQTVPDGPATDRESLKHPWRFSNRQEIFTDGNSINRHAIPSLTVLTVRNNPWRLSIRETSLSLSACSWRHITVREDYPWRFLLFFLTVLAVTKKSGWGSDRPVREETRTGGSWTGVTDFTS
jgi:hypothetical protein